MVILAGPPGFRPMHLKAAIDAGKHVFMSAYTGLPVTSKFALEDSQLDLTPELFKQGEFKLGPAPAVSVAMPGVTELI